MRGGARDGAGRPPIPKSERKVLLSCKVKPATLNMLRNLAAECGISTGQVVETIMQWYLESCQSE